MRIGIDFDNTLTDTNYTLIDLLNMYKPRSEQFRYEDFDTLKLQSIWQHPQITAKDLGRKHLCEERLFEEMDLAILAKDTLNELIQLGDEIFIITERPLIDYFKVHSFLQRKGLQVDSIHIIAGVNKRNIQNIIQDLHLDIYIEDNPYVIGRCKQPLPLIIVREQYYNEECHNLMRLECFSQLKDIRKRAKLRIKKIQENTAEKAIELAANPKEHPAIFDTVFTGLGDASTQPLVLSAAKLVDKQVPSF